MWVTPAERAGRHPSRASREGGHADPRGVLLSVDQLVVAAGDSIRRLRHFQSATRELGDQWADDRSLEEMVTQLDEVRRRLMRLRDEARQSGTATYGELRVLPPDPED
jgi:hypothetical protein